MWQPKKLAIKTNKLNRSSSGQTDMEVTELWADNVMLSNGIELNNWDQDPIQFIVCDHCGMVQCSLGNWLSPRNAGDYVLFIPEFAQMSQGSWELTEYQPPHFFDKYGPLFFDLMEYSYLRDLIPLLPPKSLLKNLTSKEAALLLQWEAPFKALGEFPNLPIFQKQFLLSSNQPSDDEIISQFESILGESFESAKPVFIKGFSGTKETVEFFFEDLEYKSWRPLYRDVNDLKLLLSSGFIVEDLQ